MSGDHYCLRHGFARCTCRWSPARLVALAVLLAVLLAGGSGCSSAGWQHFLQGAHLVLGIGARLAPAACALAGGKPADCERVRLVAQATDEARRALDAACGERAQEGACAAAAVDAAKRADELARELTQAAPAPVSSGAKQ